MAPLRSAVVTGGAHGIGREIARRLSARGFAVVVADLDEPAAQQVVADLPGAGFAHRLDVRDPDGHERVARVAVEVGPLAVWVNNAGVLQADKAWTHPVALVESTVDVNLKGVIYGCRAAVAAMGGPAAGPADIINLASMSAWCPTPGLAVYAATKAAVLSFTTSLAGDLRAAGLSRIRVHALCPDSVDTTMVRDAAPDEDSWIIFTAPRLLRAEEVADAALGLLGSRRLVRSLPARRSLLAHVVDLAPSAAGPLAPLFRRRGNSRRLAARSGQS